MEIETQENGTYEFIGRLALVLCSQNIKMSFGTLSKLLVDNGLDEYQSHGCIAATVSAASRFWEEAEEGCRTPVICGAIENAFVDKERYCSWAFI